MTKILELIVELSLEGEKLETSRRDVFQDLLDKFQAEVRELLTPRDDEDVLPDDDEDAGKDDGEDELRQDDKPLE